MELHRASNAILRLQSTSSHPPLCFSRFPPLLRCSADSSSRRCFSQSTRRRSTDSRSTSEPRSGTNNAQSHPTLPPATIAEIFAEADISTGGKPPEPRKAGLPDIPSHPSKVSSPFDDYKEAKGNMTKWVSTLYEGYKKRLMEQPDILNRPPPRTRSQPRSKDEADFESIFHTKFPDPARTGSKALPVDIWDKGTSWAQEVKAMDRNLHLFPRHGRLLSVHSNLESDLGVKLKLLNALARKNNINVDSRMQRFHERPGLKRKRLVRQRWRKRFAQSFSAVCKRAEYMAKKGW